eukprot:CAMPEP_0196659526 /NCGR_PEP_ID=MMETSP1086-20130531/35454_1 /TAXON_ID=77921 /ORGANISM="Cyanoptyche  gloeocystis , Strain SAG4.97" /LENGTH=379 /DNA_ID=CAMNT_0041993545 /DNA_START=50 /DNA_END=1189 /DNA_ORIENTATION=+
MAGLLLRNAHIFARTGRGLCVALEAAVPVSVTSIQRALYLNSSSVRLASTFRRDPDFAVPTEDFPAYEDEHGRWFYKDGTELEVWGIGAKTKERPIKSDKYETVQSYDSKKGWLVSWRRIGVIAKKCGMMPLWDVYGARHALTVLQVEDCVVSQLKTPEKEGHYGVQIAAGYIKPKNVKPQMYGHFLRSGIEPRRHLREFKVTPDATVAVGTPITAMHFIPGQFVDVQGTTIGKGFQGAMKRWGFAGQGASHGNSLSHRAIGSTGQRQDPGRVFPGKKMPGHMGCDRRTVQNLRVYKIDPVRNLIYLIGSVPGHEGSYVRVTDAFKKRFTALPPLPTYIQKPDQPVVEELVWTPPNSPFRTVEVVDVDDTPAPKKKGSK